MNLIQGYNGITTKVVHDHDTNDIMQLLISSDHKYNYQVEKFSDTLKKEDPKNQLYYIWKYLRDNVVYTPDKSIKQQLKSPARLIHDGSGDCKSYSLFIGSVLRNLNIPYAYRFVSFKNYDETPTHVYVVAYPGTNKEIILDAVLDRFNYEKPYNFKKDKKMLNMLTGIDGNEIGSFGSWWRRNVNIKSVKHLGSEVSKNLTKAYKTMLKFFPGTFMIRNGIMAIAAKNLLHSRAKLRMGLISEEEARKRGYNIEAWKKLNSEVNNFLDNFKNTWKGDPNKLRKAIETGHLEISGLDGEYIGEPITLATIGASIAAAIPIVLKVLDKIGQMSKDVTKDKPKDQLSQEEKDAMATSTLTPEQANQIIKDTNQLSSSQPGYTNEDKINTVAHGLNLKTIAIVGGAGIGAILLINLMTNKK